MTCGGLPEDVRHRPDGMRADVIRAHCKKVQFIGAPKDGRALLCVRSAEHRTSPGAQTGSVR